jgi:hypothetical protein
MFPNGKIEWEKSKFSENVPAWVLKFPGERTGKWGARLIDGNASDQGPQIGNMSKKPRRGLPSSEPRGLKTRSSGPFCGIEGRSSRTLHEYPPLSSPGLVGRGPLLHHSIAVRGSTVRTIGESKPAMRHFAC